MSAEQFQNQVALNRTLADYLDEVSHDADPHLEHRTGVEAALFLVAAYALYRVAKNHLDYKRGLEEAELRDKMLDQVAGLIEKGWGKDKALEAVLKVSKEIATLRTESPILKAALDLLPKAPDSSGGH
ncbi:MAG: hypothetical protein C0467_27690 [Planctomycetaceae bacterium]|nr:hypothetical protein [Planctomycetaceae bacterium]